jgi:hypothetical protein
VYFVSLPQRRERRHRAGHRFRPLRREHILERAAGGFALDQLVRFPIADAKPLEREVPHDSGQVATDRAAIRP